VHFTSFAVKGLPSCHLTPRRSGKRNSVPSSLHGRLFTGFVAEIAPRLADLNHSMEASREQAFVKASQHRRAANPEQDAALLDA
jgi:hypothetical protein